METILSGMALTPGRLNPHRCILTRAAAQSISTGGSGANISWTTATKNTDGMWVSGTTVTIQSAGTYDIGAGSTFATGATGVRAINVMKNGGIVADNKRNATNQSDPIIITASDLFAVGDQVTVGLFHTQGASLNATLSWLSVIQTGGA